MSTSSPSPRAPTLTTLPPELLQCIATYLSAWHSRPHLSAFSLASKTCHAAATPCLFYSLRLTIPYTHRQRPLSSRAHLALRIAEWRGLLTRRGAHQYVHSLRVREKYVVLKPGIFERARLACLDDLVDPEDEFANALERDANPLHLLGERTFDDEDEMVSWRELAKLTADLPALTAVHWDCSWPMVDCMRDAILASPSLGLHLEMFWFRRYLGAENSAPGELALLLHNQLREVRVRSSRYKWAIGAEYTLEAILALATGLNSALRHVSLLVDNRGETLSPYGRGTREPRPPWPGFAAVPIPTFRPAPLRSLEVGGKLAMDVDFFQTIFRTCDLSQLKTLKLRVSYKYKGLKWLAAYGTFPSLSILVFGVEGDAFPGPEFSDQDLAAPFLSALPALSGIRMIGGLEQDIFAALLEKHGATLRRLWTPSPGDERLVSETPQPAVFFNAERVAALQHSCPLLEDLSLTVSRSLGNATEVSMYRNFGRLGRLRTLNLVLDCEDTSLDLKAYDDDPTPIYPEFDDFDLEIYETDTYRNGDQGRDARKGHFRRAMLNAALDETLARSIFQIISLTKPGLPSDLPLSRLELRPIRGRYHSDADEVMDHLSKWWLLESHLPHRDMGEPIATRIFSPGENDEEIYGPPRVKLSDDQAESIFRKIWPDHAYPGSGWSEDWSSLPLAI